MSTTKSSGPLRAVRWSNANYTALQSDSGSVQLISGDRSLISTRPTVMAIGSSLATQSSINGSGVTGACPYYGHLQIVLALMGNPWRWVDTTAIDGTYGSGVLLQGVFGWSGGKSSDIAPYYSSLISPYKPQFVFILINDNDTVSGTETPADTAARTLAMVDLAIADGTVPILFAGAPCTSINSSALQTRYYAIHNAIEDGLSSRPSCIYIPTYNIYTDTSQTYGPQPGNSGLMANATDGIHPRTIAFELALATVERIRAKTKIVPFVLPTPGDPALLNTNNLMFGTDTPGTGVSGNVAKGYVSSSGLASATVTASKVLRYGKEVLQIDVSTTGAQTGTVDIFAMNQAGISTGWSIGDFVTTIADIEFDESVAIVGVKTPQVQCTMTGAVTSYPTVGGVLMGHALGADTAGAMIRPGLRMKLATPPAPIPHVGSDNVTAVRPYFFLKCINNAASVVCRFYIHSFSLINLSK